MYTDRGRAQKTICNVLGIGNKKLLRVLNLQNKLLIFDAIAHATAATTTAELI